jgi:hypothetical protein
MSVPTRQNMHLVNSLDGGGAERLLTNITVLRGLANPEGSP